MNQQKVNKKLEQLTQKIVDQFQPKQIILFGSFAWGEPKPDSDVDLLVVKKTKNTRQLAREIDGFIFPRPFPIDLIVYTPEQLEKRKQTGNFFIRDIVEKGKVLYAK